MSLRNDQYELHPSKAARRTRELESVIKVSRCQGVKVSRYPMSHDNPEWYMDRRRDYIALLPRVSVCCVDTGCAALHSSTVRKPVDIIFRK